MGRKIRPEPKGLSGFLIYFFFFKIFLFVLVADLTFFIVFILLCYFFKELFIVLLTNSIQITIYQIYNNKYTYFFFF